MNFTLVLYFSVCFLLSHHMHGELTGSQSFVRFASQYASLVAALAFYSTQD